MQSRRCSVQFCIFTKGVLAGYYSSVALVHCSSYFKAISSPLLPLLSKPLKSKPFARCKCVTGYGGSNCDQLAMVAYKCDYGGLCLRNGSTTWGGSVVEADDGSWHMYVTNSVFVNSRTLMGCTDPLEGGSAHPTSVLSIR